jgi:hypothetical protein
MAWGLPGIGFLAPGLFGLMAALHRTPLLETSGVCFIEDPLEITNPYG